LMRGRRWMLQSGLAMQEEHTCVHTHTHTCQHADAHARTHTHAQHPSACTPRTRPGAHGTPMRPWHAYARTRLRAPAASVGYPPSAEGGLDFYSVLGVAPDASPAGVRKAYTQLMRELHPDRAALSGAGDSTTQLCALLNEIYEVCVHAGGGGCLHARTHAGAHTHTHTHSNEVCGASRSCCDARLRVLLCLGLCAGR
jgi:hypothetical protein